MVAPVSIGLMLLITIAGALCAFSVQNVSWYVEGAQPFLFILGVAATIGFGFSEEAWWSQDDDIVEGYWRDNAVIAVISWLFFTGMYLVGGSIAWIMIAFIPPVFVVCMFSLQKFSD